MAFFMNLFGSSKKGDKNPPVRADGGATGGADNGILGTITSHNKKVDSYDQRIEVLEGKIAKCKKNADGHMAKNQKTRALQELRRAKMFTTEIAKLEGLRFKLEQQTQALASSSITNDGIRALDRATKLMKQERERNGIDEDAIADIQDQFTDEMLTSNAISETLAQDWNVDEEDEDELLENWKMEKAVDVEYAKKAEVPSAPVAQTQGTNNTPVTLPMAPQVVPVTSGGGTIAGETEEDAELRRLQSEMF